MPFERVDTTARPPEHIRAAVWGQPKEGKSTFALSAKPPLYVFNFDQGLEPLLQSGKYAEKEIYVSTFLLPEKFDLAVYLPLRDRFMAEWASACALAAKAGGTVILDTASQADKLVRDVERESIEAEARARAERKGKEHKEMQTNWGPGNLMMGSLLRRPYQAGCNAVYIQRAKEVYDSNGRALGIYTMHGFGETEAIAEVVIKLFNRGQGKDVRTFGTLERTRFDHARAFLGLEVENLDWAKLTEMVAP